LDNYSQVHHNGTAMQSCPESPLAIGASGFFGPDFANAYFGGASGCLSKFQGQGQTVALFELDSYLAGDILAYAQGAVFGEPPLNVPGIGTSTVLSNVTQEVPPTSKQFAYNAITFTPNPPAASGITVEDIEVVADISMVLAMAPQANLIVYESNPGNIGSASPAALLAQMADDDTAQTISCSWGWTSGSADEQQAIWNTTAQFASQRQSFFVAAGDQGSLVAQDPYNSQFTSPQSTNPGEPIIDSPYMTVVGGTEVATDFSGKRSSETTWNDPQTPRTVNGAVQNSVTTGGFCTGTSPNPEGGTFSALPLPAWQTNVNQFNNSEINNPSARMIPDVSMNADAVVTACNVNGNGCAGQTVICQGGTSLAAPLWAAFTALVNQANGFGNASSPGPVGFLNPALYQLATASATSYTTNFNDIADGSNNNFFDDGQKTETGTVPPSPIVVNPVIPQIAAPYAQTITTAQGFQFPANALLPGAAATGTLESAGLYHAVQGYDLATGLGSPTCNLFFSLAPAAAMPPPPKGVTITYHQVGECSRFPQDTHDGSAGPGAAFVIFGLDTINNGETTAFAFDPGKLFVPLDGFSFENEDTLLSCTLNTNDPLTCPEVIFPTPVALDATVNAGATLLLTGGSGTQFIMTPVQTPGTAEESFFLSYTETAGIAPNNGGAIDPTVTLTKTNGSAADTAKLPFLDDCSLITLQ
jgi:hypothetical protein